ncbi:MAG TPA: gamma-glutamylcyclotransferase [Arcobacter sp.]|nr:gamma-glutamylcyclotransferase [Arcobacter sp.]
MSYIEKIERKIKSLHSDTTIPFTDAKVDGVSTDTLRKVLHRLHDKGSISIVKRGCFKKEEPYAELLFVYGSLKKGFDNHNLLSQYAKRLGKARTIKKFGMFEDSFGNYPYLIPTPHTRIHGELYQITRKELMDKLDIFEGSPEYYERKKIEVKSHHGVKRAFVYIQPHTTAPEDQESLKEWKDDTQHKVKRLDAYLERMVG